MDTDTWKAFEQNPVSHSVAHHMVAIADLRDRHGYARVSDVAKMLNITRGSASLTLKSLRQRGLVLEDENRFLRLSEEGRLIADSIRSKKHMILKFFRQFLGVEPEQAEVDTCKIEHLISAATAQRLARFVRYLEHDDPAVRAFLRGWMIYDQPCGKEPRECSSCATECMEALFKEESRLPSSRPVAGE